MPDPEPSRAPRAATCQDTYPITPDAATPSLAAILRKKILRDGPLRFADFMTAALYDPLHGYYARGIGQVGRDGDFFTSVSVGSVFGGLLARRFLREWQETGRPARWRIIECGAHDGRLAADVLAALAALDETAFRALEYVICEPLPALQTAQRATLDAFADRVRIVASARCLATAPLPGIAFGNEVLDALPCQLVEWRHGGWHERRVALAENGGFTWQCVPIGEPALRDALVPIGGDFPEGYHAELRCDFREFLAPLAAALSRGSMLWLDYGFARADLYHPDRHDGTLRTYANHHAGDDPLASPGACDISAHVDFTAVAEEAASLGWQAVQFCSQGAWLTGIARDWLLAMEGRPQPDALRQFQTLTHPAHLGARFHVLELSNHRPPAAAGIGL